ncbi:unnamed protein product [Didymodactylos carnosus]|uniref:Peptidase S1 domain-containing protein n=1 Tax=Didymodactylos carnosus TaxID=1234261 RepID=A0A814TKS7_9BILA|nr:unnamed protein product [Didymodactylos carnosus]CAF1161099.1 unnamed protein product [Didymodactylos carnosus]CAF3766400.1 unnamed protein product [Didymodactylos carnosus]CAF3924684.1 unnamed protein product [Didymodactylos carnosus]
MYVYVTLCFIKSVTILLLLHAVDSLKTVTMITYTCNPDVECGCSKNSAVLSKIVGGEQAIVNSWGWAVSLRLFDSHICGGSILSKYYIITASHCVLSIPSLRYASIHVGINTLSQTGQVRKIAQSFIHADYDSATHENDIAILRLTTPLDLSDLTVSTICLPNSTSALPQSVEYPLPGSTLIAIGWGVLSSESNRVSQTLQQVTLTAVPKTASTCVRSLSNSSEQFCASAQGKGNNVSFLYQEVTVSIHIHLAEQRVDPNSSDITKLSKKSHTKDMKHFSFIS